MIAETSLEAYNKIQSSGKLSRDKLTVLKCLMDYTNLTQPGISAITKLTRQTVAGRCNDLQKYGLIKVSGKRKGNGQSYNTYRLTNETNIKPIKRIKKVSKDELLELYIKSVLNNTILINEYKEQILERMK